MPIRRDGLVTRGTRSNLIEGLGSRPMPRRAVDAVLEQVSGFVEELVGIYSVEVAPGEVGEHGSARAGASPLSSERPPRILLYGRVQSGKTAAMLLSSALCLDNGFRVIVVLTTDNVNLVRQTANRFRALAGPEVYSTVRDGAGLGWEGFEDRIADDVGAEGLVLVCSKNASNLPQVLRLLDQIGANGYPAVIFDDEADAATPDTTLAARTTNRPNAPETPSKIFSLIVENSDAAGVGLSLTRQLPHSLYIQVTATPYVLLLQCVDANLRPTSTHLIEPGEGYCGGEVFFGGFDEDTDAQQSETVVVIPDDEAAKIGAAVPPGLADSILFFLLSASALSMRSGKWPDEGFKHLAHTSHRLADHDVVVRHLRSYLRDVRKLLRSVDEAQARFRRAYAELSRSVVDLPSLDQLLGVVASAIKTLEFVKVNSETEGMTFGPRLNFLVGGNILGRGLTIDDLLVTYYIREAQTSQMDTVWQHMRMYGYRQSYIQYVRVFLPRRIGSNLKRIHLAEEELRAALLPATAAEAVMIAVPRRTRPTRPNAVNPAAVRALQAGRAQVYPHTIVRDKDRSALIREILAANRVLIHAGVPRGERPTRVPLATAIELVRHVPVAEDETGLWEPEAMTALLQNYRVKLDAGCVVYVRGFEGEVDLGRDRARLSGPEVDLMRRASPGAPCLALVYDGPPDSPEAWFPTMVMPADAPTFVFNNDVEGG